MKSKASNQIKCLMINIIFISNSYIHETGIIVRKKLCPQYSDMQQLIKTSSLYIKFKKKPWEWHFQRINGLNPELAELSFVGKLFVTTYYSGLGYYTETHDDVIKWKHFPRYWPFVRGIHRPPVNSPHNGQWRGALMFSLICVWINGWVNRRGAGDLRRYREHYDVIVMGNVIMFKELPLEPMIKMTAFPCQRCLYFVCFVSFSLVSVWATYFVLSSPGTKCQRWLWSRYRWTQIVKCPDIQSDCGNNAPLVHLQFLKSSIERISHKICLSLKRKCRLYEEIFITGYSTAVFFAVVYW